MSVRELEGVDVDIEISLKEYGFAWEDLGDEYRFFYGIDMNGEEYTRFSSAEFSKNTNVKDEFSWADFEAVDSFVGGGFLDFDLISQIQTLYQYYGSVNIFGEDYYEGMTYAEVTGEKESIDEI